MTNLTEQLATESLPEYTEFYVRKKDGSTDTQTWLNRRHSSAVEWWNTFNITEVLAKVPSYEEYQKLLSYQLAKNEGVEINAELEAENIKLKTENKWYSEQLNEAVKQNDKLKELLKECKHIMAIEKDFASCHFEKHKLDELLAKIDQVLGEE